MKLIKVGIRDSGRRGPVRPLLLEGRLAENTTIAEVVVALREHGALIDVAYADEQVQAVEPKRRQKEKVPGP